MAANEVVMKLLLIGDSGAGKSALLLRYAQNEFTDDFISTIGMDFKFKTVMLNNKPLKVQLWDTAGQERFRTITQSYYRGAQGILLVFDLTNEASFQNVRKWIQDVREYAEEEVCMVLVGNKSDLVFERVVDKAQAEQVATEYNLKYFEASAKTNDNVETTFLTLIREVHQKVILKPKQGVPIVAGKKSGCC